MDVAAASDGRACCRAGRRSGGWPRRRCGGRPRPVLGLERPKRPIGQHRAGPGPEVLCGEVTAGGLAQVGVHVVGGDIADLAVVVDVCEQLLAREAPGSAGSSPASRRSRRPTSWVVPGLAAEPEAHGRALDRGVPATHRRQPERPVETRVFVIAHPDEGRARGAARRRPAPSRAAARGGAGPRRSARRIRGRARAKASIRSNLSDPRAGLPSG